MSLSPDPRRSLMRRWLPILTVLALVSPVRGATFVVPDSVATVTLALSMAAGGDTVLVQPGTYPESVALVDGVALLSAVLHGAELDGGDVASVVTADGCSAGTVLDGFIIRKGGTSGLGGGLCASKSAFTVSNCRFEDNGAMHGGGIGADASDLTIIGCEFQNNDATQTGGGISMTGASSPVIQGCLFDNNTALAGGGIAVRNGATPSVSLCLLDANQADQGGAVWYDLFSGGSLAASTLVSNDATSLGGGLFFSTLATTTVTECIIAFSVAGEGVFAVAGAVPVFGCNVIFANAGGDSLAGVTDLGTNVMADPLFCDAASGVYSLQDTSPALPNGPCGLIGAFGAGGCGAVSAGAGVETASWGRVKSLFR